MKFLAHLKFALFSEIVGRPEWGLPKQKAISMGQWKLISMIPEKENLPNSLFYLKSDPEEQNNLYDVQIPKRTQLLNQMANISS